MNEIVLDLGEYGEISIVAVEHQAGFSEAGVGDKVRAKFAEVLQVPIMGIGNAMAAGLSEGSEGVFGLNEFSLEFHLGVQLEAGVESGVVGVVAKIVPNGNFKCTYTWGRRL